MGNFERSMEFVFKWEGGYVNRADDPGGETRYGISKRAHPDVDIKALTKEQAMEIYRADYWLRAGCEGLPWPDCLVLFDTAVNMGVPKANRFKDSAIDWRDFLLMRVRFYCELATEKRSNRLFLRGWINRVVDLYETAKDHAHI